MTQESHKSAGSSSNTFARFLYHLHPVKIPEMVLDIRRTFGLGGMSLVLILLLALSGTMMLFVYRKKHQAAVPLSQPYPTWCRGN